MYDRYGGPERLKTAEVDRPEPGPGEVRVGVEAVGLNAYDWRMLSGTPFLVRLRNGLFRPKNRILGADVAGVVEATGARATRFRVGDCVFGCLEGSGASGLAAGGLAESVAARETGLALMPDGMTFAEAAALPMAGGTALIAVRDSGAVTAGMDVLVNGAAGGVGTFAVQIGKALGARVTGVCAANHAELVSGLGAGAVVDYRAEDFTSARESWDVIVDVAASRSVRDLRKGLRPGGVIVAVGFSSLRRIARFGLSALNKRASKRVAMLAVDNWNDDHVRVLAEMVQAGQVAPVIDRELDWAQVQDAFAYLAEGHAGGKIIVLVGS
jgi:NADPH:quinone reductase-like Zn-dependent oxidoreductase